MTLQESLAGITCPVVTPFNEDESIDDDALRTLVDSLQSAGIDAVFPNGTTGEFASLSPDERRRILEIVVDEVDGELPVVAGAGATSVVETLEYIDEAAEIGADAAVIVPPYFHTANAPAGNQRYFEAVADESALPLLLYNIPACTGQEIAIDTVSAVADHENIIGLKDSSGDLEYFLGAMRATPAEFLHLQGYDSLLAPALRMGADGGVNALSNAVPEAFVELYDTTETDRATALQAAIADLFEGCGAYGFAPASKAALEYRGVILTDTVRPPLVTVPDAGRETIQAGVDGVLEQ
ncbi:dihydrodipicolinate synthase family protein [Natronolimnobius sp. AArcel1]|uniref:dihydrodipicolinate synthase family protein n=1 Tax=Natronolimnobius sp. AArcel1 TaxID=1679093 RepID=UPI0013ED524E|nr:dihydrodipicolinate synthase family protein [Natronolimnobius sp. AArcel1]NGM68060.1 dihydrodipicolinate synthase family protein [Natronolimnobius sp. AArcel1]